MSIDYNNLPVFLKIAQARGLSLASRQYKIPKATLSRRLAELEDDIGHQLFYRDTRNFTLTDIGKDLYESLEPLYREVDVAYDLIEQKNKEPGGLLTVTAPVEFGQVKLIPFIAKFREAYPNVRVATRLTNEVLDLARGEVDVAIRFGNLKDSSLKTKALFQFETYLVATPDYLEKRCPVRMPRDIESHDVIGFSAVFDSELPLYRQGSRILVKISPQFSTDNILAVKQAAACGLGIAALPEFLVESDLENGRLVRILPEWRLEKARARLVFLPQRYQSKKIRCFLDFCDTHWE